MRKPKTVSDEIKPDTSPKVYQKERLKTELNVREHIQWSDKQKEIINAALDKHNSLIFVDGLWGTGKTAIAIYIGLKLLNLKKISEIYYLRNPVESSSAKIGYLKGDLISKFEVYLEPAMDKLNEFLPKQEVDFLIKNEIVQGLPIGFIRGRSFNSSLLIIDEASSLTKDELLLTLSRAGKFTKVLCIGSEFQSDIGTKSGFKGLCEFFNDEESRQNGIQFYELKDELDIFRSDLVRFIMMKLKAAKQKEIVKKEEEKNIIAKPIMTKSLDTVDWEPNRKE